MITVTLIGPDYNQFAVTIISDATVRDVVTTKYDLFWRLLKRNGTFVSFFHDASHRLAIAITVKDM